MSSSIQGRLPCSVPISQNGRHSFVSVKDFSKKDTKAAIPQQADSSETLSSDRQIVLPEGSRPSPLAYFEVTRSWQFP